MAAGSETALNQQNSAEFIRAEQARQHDVLEDDRRAEQQAAQQRIGGAAGQSSIHSAGNRSFGTPRFVHGRPGSLPVVALG